MANEGYEVRDIRTRVLGWVGVGLFVVCGITFVKVGLFQAALARFGAAPVPEVAVERQLPPLPRLQTTPAEEVSVLRHHESLVLESYGWVEPRLGVARVPIERGMELLVERGIQPWGAGEPR